MIRSILGTIGSLLLTAFLYLFVPLALIGIAAVLLLGVGSLLTRVFPVTTFEATLILTLVGIPTLWLYMRLLRQADSLMTELPDEESAPAEPPDSWEPLSVLPRHPARRNKRRRM